MSLSNDALVFGMSYLRAARSTLEFGGPGAVMEITPRARAALNELIAAGYAARNTGARTVGAISGREYFRGATPAGAPYLAQLAQAAYIDPLSTASQWPTFTKSSHQEETTQ